MLARVLSCAVLGMDGVVVEVEVYTSPGLPKIIIVGLPDAAVQESRERVQPAIKNSGLSLPRKHITVNLAPVSVRKAGPVYDLPIALGILAASGQVPAEALEGTLVLCELSLDGSVRKYCQLEEDGGALLKFAMSQMQLTARAYHRTLKLARTIADLAAAPQILSAYLAEALQYRARLDVIA